MDRQCSSCGGFCKKSGCERENVPLYAAPPQRPWQGLTEQDTLQIRAEWEVRDYRLSELCRAIEAKLREKNA